MCYTHFVPKGKLPTLRHYVILYYIFRFVKHFFMLGLFFCHFLHFSGFLREKRQKWLPFVKAQDTRRRCHKFKNFASPVFGTQYPDRKKARGIRHGLFELSIQLTGFDFFVVLRIDPFRHGDEGVPLFEQPIHHLNGRIHRGIINVVHQHHRSVFDPAAAERDV